MNLILAKKGHKVAVQLIHVIRDCMGYSIMVCCKGEHGIWCIAFLKISSFVQEMLLFFFDVVRRALRQLERIVANVVDFSQRTERFLRLSYIDNAWTFAVLRGIVMIVNMEQNMNRSQNVMRVRTRGSTYNVKETGKYFPYWEQWEWNYGRWSVIDLEAEERCHNQRFVVLETVQVFPHIASLDQDSPWQG